jgi:hypothetical protein
MRQVPASLTFVRRVFVNFRDGAYDWIDVKEFVVSTAQVSPREALALLLEHVRYRDSYVTGDSQDIDSVDLHGPYWLKNLSPESSGGAGTSTLPHATPASASHGRTTCATRSPHC